MKILLVCNLCPPHFLGGYGNACFDVAHALADRGHSVRLLTSSTWYSTDGDPPFVRRLLEMNTHLPSLPQSSDVIRYRHFKATVSCFHNTSVALDVLHEFQPDIVYLFNPLGIGGLALLDMFNGLGVPWVWHLMDCIPGLLLDGISPEIRTLFAASDGRLFEPGLFLCMSRRLRAEIVAQEVRQVATAEIVPGWVARPPGDHRAAYQVGGRTNFIFAGSICEHKGVSLIVEAAARLVSAGTDTFTIDLFGPGDVSSFRAHAEAMGLGAYVRFCGPISSSALSETYRNYDCLLFPTWEREPFGFVALEAAAAGCVPILTSTCGAAERLVDGAHAIKIVRTVDALTDKMAAVIRGEINLAAMGRAGAGYVRRALSLGLLIGSIEGLLSGHARQSPCPGYRRAAIEEQRRLQFLKDARAVELAFS